MSDESETVRQGDVEPLPYASLVSPKLKTIRRLPAFEANLAAGKLEAEGVDSFVADQNISVAHPLLFGEVRLQVREIDVERAEEILTRPSVAARDDDDDSDEEDDDDDYVQEAYRCPKCHRREVDLVPFSPPTRTLRTICFVLVVLFPLAFLFFTITGVDLIAMLPVPDTAIVIVWLAAICFLFCIFILVNRRKRCRQCGFEWTHGASG